MVLATATPAPARPHLIDADGGEVRETHISWVFLTPDRAYKVKKPIVLPFLDYRTPERRHLLCREEVALNRRLAPELYLGVRSLVRAGDGLRLADEGDPRAVDFAVEMRRYDESATFAARLCADAAGPEDAAAAGARLAAFHAAAEIDRCAAGAEAVKRALDDDFATLHGLWPERAAIARLERTAGAQLAALWDELDARAAAGLVRDGHGDLRLEHILLGERVDIVDCVEFEPALRRIDVAADLAFALMELHEAGRADLAEALVRAYRAAGGDPGSDALLAFFAAYRAEVRAKVALLRAEQRGPAAAEPDRAHAQRLLALAARLRWRAHAPLVIAVAGVSASGKSTVARPARRRRPASPSSARTWCARPPPGCTPPSARPRRSTRTTSAVPPTPRWAPAPPARRDGVIVDATFRRRADRDAFRDAWGPACGCCGSSWSSRPPSSSGAPEHEPPIPARVSDAGIEVVRTQLRTAEPLDEVPGADHALVRADRSPDGDPRRDRRRRAARRVRNPPRKCRGSPRWSPAPVAAMLCAWRRR